MSLIENALAVILLIAVCLLIDGVMLILIKVVPMKKPTPVKLERYESGHIPTIPPKYTLPMQYFGYVFMFMACEPILVLLLLFVEKPNVFTVGLVTLAFVLLTPAFYVSYKYTQDIAYGVR